jgi:hypothetical protein
MMISARSTMIKTEGTMMAITIVPLFVSVGASTVSVRFAILIHVKDHSRPERKKGRERHRDSRTSIWCIYKVGQVLEVADSSLVQVIGVAMID